MTTPINVRLSHLEKKRLNTIAAKKGYFYRNRPSLTKLLRAIASGQLEVKSPLLVEESTRQLPSSLIQLRIEVRANINGILFKISEIIASKKGDIYLAKASEDSNIMFISLDLPLSKNLVKLAEEIKKINFTDIIQFNSRKQKEKLLSELAYDDYKTYFQAKEQVKTNKESKVNKEKFLDDRLRYYIEKLEYLIIDVSYTISLKLEIKHQKGTLFKILQKIADNQISISSVKIDSIYNLESGKKKLVDLRLNIDPEAIQNEVNTVGKIKKLIDNLDVIIKPVEIIPTKLD